MWWNLACAAPVETADSGPPPYCATLEEEGTEAPAPCTDNDCAGSLTSGRVEVWLMTDVGVDPTAPEYTTFKDWTLSPAGGGVAQTGQTDGDRGMSALVGAGTWTFASTFVRGGRTCTASLDIEVVASSLSRGCARMTCPVE